jgi:hypothetical protein
LQRGEHHLLGASTFRFETACETVRFYLRAGEYISSQINAVQRGRDLRSDRRQLSAAGAMQSRRDMPELSWKIVVDEQDIHDDRALTSISL